MINIEKSQPAPASLAVEKQKPNGTYLQEDVITRLRDDSFGKCYICEEKSITSANVEHVIPHRGDLDLKFDWNNLLLSCSHCNNTKLAKYSNILNCTNPQKIVTNLIDLKMESFPMSEVEVKALSNDADVEETVKLLDDVYNGTTSLKRMEASHLRKKVLDEMRAFQGTLNDYYFEPGLNPEEKESLKGKIRRMLSKESPFTAFKIRAIQRNPHLAQEFGEMIP